MDAHIHKNAFSEYPELLRYLHCYTYNHKPMPSCEKNTIQERNPISACGKHSDNRFVIKTMQP